MSGYLFHYDRPAVADDGDELSIQVKFRARMKMLAPTVRLVATPNGAKRNIHEAMRAKAEGMSKGFADLTVLWPGGGIAFLEMKARRGALKPEQVEWLNWLHLAGFQCGCFRSVDNAIAFLRECGAPMLSHRVAA